jgi:hypothetical protein
LPLRIASYLTLEKDELVEIVHKALQQWHPKSGTQGRKVSPAEVVLRLLVLRHLKNWSYETLEEEVRPNLVYRQFTRIGGDGAGCQDDGALGEGFGSGGDPADP